MRVKYTLNTELQSETPVRIGRPPVDDEPILRCLAKRKTVTETSGITGHNVNTIYKRLRDPLFNARLQEAKALELAKATQFATESVEDALGVLVKIAKEEVATDKDKIAAAKTVIEMAMKLREEVDLRPRLAALEAALGDAGGSLPLPQSGGNEDDAEDRGTDK